MKTMIIGISITTAVAFLILAVITTLQIFFALLGDQASVRGELWLLLVICFTGGVIMLSMAWGIAELTETRRNQRELMMQGINPNTPDEDDE